MAGWQAVGEPALPHFSCARTPRAEVGEGRGFSGSDTNKFSKQAWILIPQPATGGKKKYSLSKLL